MVPDADLPSAPKVEAAASAPDIVAALSAAPAAPDFDVELTFDHEFFTPSVGPISLPPFVEEEDPVVLLLTAAEHQRRLAFRRRVAQLMAMLAAFTLLAFLLRLTQSG